MFWFVSSAFGIANSDCLLGAGDTDGDEHKEEIDEVLDDAEDKEAETAADAFVFNCSGGGGGGGNRELDDRLLSCILFDSSLLVFAFK